MGGVAYVTSHSGNASSHLLCAKSKLKGSTVRSTIPKLELCGILFGLEILEKLINILNQKFSFASVHLWADAKVPLSWICSDIPHSLKYISNRTQKANTIIGKHDVKLHYIESGNNSADLLTKNFDKVYHDLPLWMNGPACIRKNEFPEFKETNYNKEIGNPDQNIYVNAIVKDTNILAKVKNVSSFTSLLKITHILLKAGRIILSHRLKDNKKASPKLPAGKAIKTGPRLKLLDMEPNDVNKVFYLWISHFQNIYFHSYLEYFSKKKEIFGQGCQCCQKSKITNTESGIPGAESDNSKGNQKVHIQKGFSIFGNLHLVIDSENILRVKTRASKNFGFNYRYPIILPKNAHFSKLYAQEIHNIYGHVGPNQTLSACRSTVWITAGRTLINKLINNCSICKLHSLKLYRTPKFPDLPETRMSFGHPFQHIGIDMSGHYVLYNKGVEIKRYICIITCLSSRATHALVCRDNSTYAFVHCLRRHIYRYGAPQSILTDNAKNFENTNNILEEHSKNPAVKQLLSTKNIRWSFTPNYSPWAGAVFESMVKIIKKILRKTFNSRKMTIDDMITLVYHAEHCANQRPISYVSQNDSYTILTPNLLIFGRDVRQENWLDTEEFTDPDFTLISKNDLGNAYKALRTSMCNIERDFNA